jgi:hypothetical protein
MTLLKKKYLSNPERAESHHPIKKSRKASALASTKIHIPTVRQTLVIKAQ